MVWSKDPAKNETNFPGNADLWMRGVFKTLGDAVLIITPDRKLVEINPAAEEMLGYRTEELRGRSVEIIHIDHDNFIKAGQIINRAFEKGETARFRNRLKRRDGRSFPISNTVSLLHDDQGRPVGILNIVRDLTDWINIEQELERQVADRTASLEEISNRFATILEQAPVGILSIDHSGNITEANPAALRVLGSPGREQTMKLNVLQLPALAESGMTKVFEKVLQSGEPQDMEAWYTSLWGKKAYLRARLVPRLDKDGRRVGVIQILEDATASRQAEAQLRKLYQAVESSPVSVVITSLDGAIEYVNPRFCQTTGFSKEEVEGENPRLLKSGEQSPHVYNELWQAITNGRPWRGELQNRKRNGELYWERAHISPVIDETGRVTNFVAVKEDITEQKRVEAELEESRREAESANQAKSVFLANMSHEIRTPMNAIIGMTELTLDTDLTDEQRDYLETVKSSGEHLLNLIDNILDLSKIEAGKMDLEAGRFNLRSAVDGVLKGLATRAVSRGLEISSRFHPETPELLIGDPIRLRQIILNLVGNAVKFTAQGQVRVEIEPMTKLTDRVELRIIVSDTGPGLSPEQQEIIFEPFSQADNSTTRKYGGSGLGLTISKRLVELMGGQIWVNSQPGQGATFGFTAWFDLDRTAAPVETDDPVGDPGRPTVVKGVDLSELNILVAEDNPVNQKMTLVMLERRGARVTVVSNGRQAVEATRRERFDLILMDVQMPEMDGLEATEIIRRELTVAGGCPPIIALTAHAMKGDREKFLAAGMDDYLSKPMAPQKLYRAVEQAVMKKYCLID